MLNIDENYNIFLTRGDTAYINIDEFKNEDDTTHYLTEGDHIYFRLRTANSLLTKELTLDLENNTAQLELLDTDTINLPTAIHKYEMELVTVANEHFTFIANKDFVIGRELEVHHGG